VKNGGNRMLTNIADYLGGIIKSIGIPLFVFDLDRIFQFINILTLIGLQN
jgi:hypothetical protein